MSTYEQILEKYRKIFTPSPEEYKKFSLRLKSYSKQELKNLNDNFEHFGINEVLECIYDLKL